MAWRLSSEDWVRDQYAGIHQFYVSNGHSLDGVLTINIGAQAFAAATGSGFVNSYDVVDSSWNRNRVANAIANDPAMIFTSVMSSFGRAIRLAGVVTPDVALTVTVVFPDESTVVYEFNWDTKKWGYVAGSAVDSHGNSIPASDADYVNGEVGSGEFNFAGPGNPNDLSDFLNRARLAGVPIVGWGDRIVCGTADGNVQCQVF